ncbi:MAG: UPF0109 protein [Chthonomonas sp.]|nr:KH domain-containing protein [Fimbriimonadaceae bacterium]
MSYRPFVEYVVGAVIERPDMLEIEEEVSGNVRTFNVHVAQEDVGKLIGKGGRVVSAIRSVVSCIAAKSKEKAFVKIVTDN